MSTVDLMGFTGVFLILLAYVLNVFGFINRTNLYFIVLNLAGAGLACLASIFIKYLPFVILEGTWAMVSLYALVRYVLKL